MIFLLLKLERAVLFKKKPYKELFCLLSKLYHLSATMRLLACEKKAVPLRASPRMVSKWNFQAFLEGKSSWLVGIMNM